MSSYQIMLFSVFHPGSYSKLFLLKLGRCKATVAVLQQHCCHARLWEFSVLTGADQGSKKNRNLSLLPRVWLGCVENVQPNSFSLYLKEGRSICKEMGILRQICQYVFITNYYTYGST